MKLVAIASQPSNFAEMAALARALAGRGHDVQLLSIYSSGDRFPHRWRASDIQAVTMRFDGAGQHLSLRTLDMDAAWRGVEGEGAWRSPAWTLLRRVGWRDVFADPRTTGRGVVMLRHYARMVRFFERAIDGFDAVLLPEDVVGPMWPLAIRAAHARGAAALVFPYTIATREEPLQSVKDAADYQTRANPLAARLFPRWRLETADADVVRLPSGHVFAHEGLGVAPPDPWLMNSGFADAVCVDSQAMADYFVAAGLPDTQTIVVGSVSQDAMFERLQRRDERLTDLRRDLGLTGDKPLLLLSGCPNQLLDRVPRGEFARFEEIAHFVGETLAPLGDAYHLVVRPHPNYGEFGAMLAPHGFASSNVPTWQLVPLATTFVAFASATIRWAVACAVPTLNFDVFRYGYADFAQARGVVTVSAKDEFLAAASTMRPDGERHAQLRAIACADATRWSAMDGAGVERIERTIAAAVARRHGNRPEESAV
jgi:hypothetical protein